MSFFAHNIIHFARILRHFNLTIAPADVGLALNALKYLPAPSHENIKNTLSAIFVKSQGELGLFQHAFDLFFTKHNENSESLNLLMRTQIKSSGAEDDSSPLPQTILQASTALGKNTKDFAKMSPAEQAEMIHAIKNLRLNLPKAHQTRAKPAPSGILDLAAIRQKMLKSGGEIGHILHKRKQKSPINLLVIADISGSMAGYTDFILPFIENLCRANDRIVLIGHHADLYPLHNRHQTNISWNSGSNLGESIEQMLKFHGLFDKKPLCLFFTDGLNRGDHALWQRGLMQLQGEVKQIWWLNPLLRYDEYQAITRGAAIIEKIADVRHPIHNLQSLLRLGDKIAHFA